MLAEYAGVLVVVTLGVIIVCAMLGVHLLLGPHREFAEKQEPFECGERQIQRAAPALRGQVLHGRDPVRRLRRRGDLLLPVGRGVHRARLVRLRR